MGRMDDVAFAEYWKQRIDREDNDFVQHNILGTRSVAGGSRPGSGFQSSSFNVLGVPPAAAGPAAPAQPAGARPPLPPGRYEASGADGVPLPAAYAPSLGGTSRSTLSPPFAGHPGPSVQSGCALGRVVPDHPELLGRGVDRKHGSHKPAGKARAGPSEERMRRQETEKAINSLRQARDTAGSAKR